MPFTFAHPAAIIPINSRFKSKFCLTGLVLGSMAPDFEYFIRLKPYSAYGHNLIGFLYLIYLYAFIGVHFSFFSKGHFNCTYAQAIK